MHIEEQEIRDQVRKSLSMETCQCERQEIAIVSGNECCIRCGKPIHMQMNENTIRAVIDYLQPGSSGKYGRNSPCFCGSGKKYKQCCGKKFI